MNHAMNRRQSLRRGMIFGAFLLFPVVLNYLSPYLIIDGAFQGIVSGSALAFGLMFLSALVLGRAWCGWLCPGAGMQEAAFFIRDRKASQKGNWIKWLIWIPWLAIIVTGFVLSGGIHQVNPLLNTENVVSLTDWHNYVIYYTVVILVMALTLAAGNRAFCHYGCWMAPFLITGRKLRNLGRWPSLCLQADPARCSDCKTCLRNCPMSLDVNALVHSGSMEHSECILCGTCVDNCARGVIQYQFSRGK
jgi:ferredoxin-type protein NapH